MVSGSEIKDGPICSISAVVKRVAEHAGLDGNYSGHSLRIGGATAAVAGGMSMEQIRAIGGWESDAVFLYLRAVGPAMAQASKRMGF